LNGVSGQFAICGLGVYGRGESTVSTPCDLVLIYGDDLKRGEKGLEPITSMISNALDMMELTSISGFVLDSDECRGTLSEWRERVAVSAAQPSLQKAISCIAEMRHITGEESLSEQLRSYALNEITGHQDRLLSLLKSASTMPVGFDFFGRLKMERSGDHRGEFNLQHFSLEPLECTARMMSYRVGITDIYTPNRIKRLMQVGELGIDLATKLLMAYHDFARIKFGLEVNGSGSERDGLFLERNNISHDDEICLKLGLDALFNLQRIVYQSVEE
jgi:signal-transduction protein with cAMP-binding, CBS, and nucleotidyltransferase domain